MQIERQTQSRAIDQLHTGCVDDPACGWFSHDFAEMQRLISFGEVFAVRKRVPISNQNRRQLERACPKTVRDGAVMKPRGVMYRDERC